MVFGEAVSSSLSLWMAPLQNKHLPMDLFEVSLASTLPLKPAAFPSKSLFLRKSGNALPFIHDQLFSFSDIWFLSSCHVTIHLMKHSRHLWRWIERLGPLSLQEFVQWPTPNLNRWQSWACFSNWGAFPITSRLTGGGVKRCKLAQRTLLGSHRPLHLGL